MAFKFLHKFQKAKARQHDAILPVSYMIQIQATDDSQAVNSLSSLAKRLSLPDDEMKLDQNNSVDNQIIIYFSVYGFERFALELKKRIIHQIPLDKAQSQFFSNTNVDLNIINNHFKVGEDKNHPQFIDKQLVAYFYNVGLKSNFVNVTDLLYHLLFFDYSQEDLEEEDAGKIYHHLCTLADKLKASYNLQDEKEDKYFATLPSFQDFQNQNYDAVYVPVLNSPDTDNDYSSNDYHSNDPASSLTNNKDNTQQDYVQNDDDKAQSSPESNDQSITNDRPKTVGELRKEQAARTNTDDLENNKNDKDSSSDSKDNSDDDTSSSHSSVQDIVHSMYAPHIYHMNVEFPSFTVDHNMKNPPSLEDAVKKNDFDSQLFMLQETNHIKAQANSYLQKQAQQVNQSFNFYMTRLALQVYKQLTQRINSIRLQGQNNDKLKKSIRDYYDKQIDNSFSELKQSQHEELNKREAALKQEYEQKFKDVIAQSNHQYENSRTQTKNKLQSDAESMMNDSIAKRNATLNKNIQDSKKEAVQYLSHALQDKADKYKDMADNLGQQLFSSMQNHLNAIYPKLVDQISILMNDQLQLNYSNSRLQASNSDVYKKQVQNYHNRLQQSQKDKESSINDYENRLNQLRGQLSKRDDTTKKYDRLLSNKNKLQDDLDSRKQTIQDQQDKINDLKKQVDNAPLGQPNMTAKQKTTELNYQSLQHKFRDLQDKNQEYENTLNDLAQKLDNKKHFWEK